MASGIPTLRSVMTAFPYSIDSDAALADARRMMLEHDFGHLPVKRGSELVGVITARDLERVSAAAEPDPPARVVDLMTPRPYVVDLNAALDEVLLELADRHLDCALVTRKGSLVGIFTATDACRAFGEHLRGLRPGPGTDAA